MGPTSSFTLQEAADELGVHYMTVYRHVRNGRLDATRTKLGWEITPEALSAYTDGAMPDPAERQRRFEERLVAHDDAAVWRIVHDELGAGKSAASILRDLIVPSLHSIGERWGAGELSVLDEHQATAAASVVVARLGPFIRRAPVTHGSIIVGAPSGDMHALGPAILSDLLRANGFDAIDLGANTPPISFADVIRAAGPDDVDLRAVAITARISTEPGTAAASIINDTVEAIRAADPHVHIAVGGAGTTGRNPAEFGCDEVTSDIDAFIAGLSSPPA